MLDCAGDLKSWAFRHSHLHVHESACKGFQALQTDQAVTVQHVPDKFAGLCQRLDRRRNQHYLPSPRPLNLLAQGSCSKHIS